MITTRRGRALLVGVLLAVALGACSQDAPSALDPQGPAARRIAGVWWLMFGMATAVYVVVAGFIIAAALRGRGTDGKGRPSRITDKGFIWVGGLIVPSLILAVLAVVTVASTSALSKPAQGEPLRVEVTGYRWWWAVRYPGEDITTANEVRIPSGRSVDITLLSEDVIHSFWVPQLAGKVDLVPGQRNVIRIRADRPGEYRGQCAEYCGLQHAKMAFLVIAEPPADFERWAARQQRPRSGPTNEREAAGQVAFTRAACSGCHTIRGTDARGTLGPDLSDFGSRRTIGAVSVPNTRAHLAGWIADSQTIKPGNLMPPITLSSDDLLALVEYLESQR